MAVLIRSSVNDKGWERGGRCSASPSPLQSSSVTVPSRNWNGPNACVSQIRKKGCTSSQPVLANREQRAVTSKQVWGHGGEEAAGADNDLTVCKNEGRQH